MLKAFDFGRSWAIIKMSAWINGILNNRSLKAFRASLHSLWHCCDTFTFCSLTLSTVKRHILRCVRLPLSLSVSVFLSLLPAIFEDGQVDYDICAAFSSLKMHEKRRHTRINWCAILIASNFETCINYALAQEVSHKRISFQATMFASKQNSIRQILRLHSHPTMSKYYA